MALFSFPRSVEAPAGAGQGATVKATHKLWLTADRSRLVHDGSPEAAFLFCVPGRAIPIEEARKYGLLPEVKEVKPQETKELRPERTKKR